MACTTPPTVPVLVYIQVAASPTPAVTYAAGNAASRPYVKPGGELDFSTLHGCVMVTLKITSAGYYFYDGYGRHSLAFSDDSTKPKAVLDPAARTHHQFPNGFSGSGSPTVTFLYHNDWDGGQHDGKKHFPTSAYGVYIGNAQGFFATFDPIVDNGGNQL
ncbi:MAG TPA: hypothetical protein VHW60_12870 [Caulobacteraceae bacterium]|jgi:hypothetical protein|nr:hypothetical protein [Caulobacteraceae bacterium]